MWPWEASLGSGLVRPYGHKDMFTVLQEGTTRNICPHHDRPSVEATTALQPPTAIPGSDSRRRGSMAICQLHGPLILTAISMVESKQFQPTITSPAVCYSALFLLAQDQWRLPWLPVE